MLTKELVESGEATKLIRLKNKAWVPVTFKVSVPGHPVSLTFERGKPVKVNAQVADYLLGLTYNAGTTQARERFYSPMFELATTDNLVSTNPVKLAEEIQALKATMANLLRAAGKDVDTSKLEEMLKAADPLTLEQAELDGGYVDTEAEIIAEGTILESNTPVSQDGCYICPICSKWKTKPDLEPDRAKRSLDAHIRKAHGNEVKTS